MSVYKYVRVKIIKSYIKKKLQKFHIRIHFPKRNLFQLINFITDVFLLKTCEKWLSSINLNLFNIYRKFSPLRAVYLINAG